MNIQDSKLIVSDTGPIITFCALNKLNILHKMFQEVCIPRAVFDELNISKYPRETEMIKENSFIKVIDVKNKNEVNKLLAFGKLHRGECEAIVLSEELSVNGKNYLIIDDMYARSCADARGIITVGAIGILAQAIRLGIIPTTELECCIDVMKKEKRFYNEFLYNELRNVAIQVSSKNSHPLSEDNENISENEYVTKMGGQVLELKYYDGLVKAEEKGIEKGIEKGREIEREQGRKMTFNVIMQDTVKNVLSMGEFAENNEDYLKIVTADAFNKCKQFIPEWNDERLYKEFVELKNNIQNGKSPYLPVSSKVTDKSVQTSHTL